MYAQRRLDGMRRQRAVMSGDPAKLRAQDEKITALELDVQAREWAAKFDKPLEVMTVGRSPSLQNEIRAADITPEVVEDRRAAWAHDPIGCLGRAASLVGCAWLAEIKGAKLRDVVFMYDESRATEGDWVATNDLFDTSDVDE